MAHTPTQRCPWCRGVILKTYEAFTEIINPNPSKFELSYPRPFRQKHRKCGLPTCKTILFDSAVSLILLSQFSFLNILVNSRSYAKLLGCETMTQLEMFDEKTGG
jgi:hypothetical protein